MEAYGTKSPYLGPQRVGSGPGLDVANFRPKVLYEIGSGQAAALAAMHRGADAARAVKVAIEFDRNSGPPVCVLKL